MTDHKDSSRIVFYVCSFRIEFFTWVTDVVGVAVTRPSNDPLREVTALLHSRESETEGVIVRAP